jgi:hypothetical protein
MRFAVSPSLITSYPWNVRNNTCEISLTILWILSNKGKALFYRTKRFFSVTPVFDSRSLTRIDKTALRDYSVCWHSAKIRRFNGTRVSNRAFIYIAFFCAVGRRVSWPSIRRHVTIVRMVPCLSEQIYWLSPYQHFWMWQRVGCSSTAVVFFCVGCVGKNGWR